MVHQFIEYITSLPEVIEVPHFDKSAFKVRKKIFATYDPKRKRINLKLSVMEQDLFSLINKQAIYPVDNNWGRKGWTYFHADEVDPEILKEAIICAYSNSAPQKLLNQLPADG